jgi:hypothetical protein
VRCSVQNPIILCQGVGGKTRVVMNFLRGYSVYLRVRSQRYEIDNGVLEIKTR